jgi:hypothetical protein
MNLSFICLQYEILINLCLIIICFSIPLVGKCFWPIYGIFASFSKDQNQP